jgi:hypothetical protein
MGAPAALSQGVDGSFWVALGLWWEIVTGLPGTLKGGGDALGAVGGGSNPWGHVTRVIPATFRCSQQPVQSVPQLSAFSFLFPKAFSAHARSIDVQILTTEQSAAIPIRGGDAPF